MRIFIKNMVSQRCKMIVSNELEKLEINNAKVELGYVDLEDGVSEKQIVLLKNNLFKYGLELIKDKKIALIERVKNVIVNVIHHAEEQPEINYSAYINQQLNLDYVYLSNLFSEVEGRTIQQFIILHKIEKVKELLMYDEYNLTEISYKLNYSSVAHLSNQFKKVTGYSPSCFKKMNMHRTQLLERI